MSQQSKAEALRELLRLATSLRASAAESVTQDYIDLFLRTAIVLEERANEIAFGGDTSSNKDESEIVAAVHLNLVC
jgi:hypothetical protein